MIKFISRYVVVMAVMLVTHIPSLAYRVYYDNSSTQWTQPKVYYWNPSGGFEDPAWPGKDMIAYTGRPELVNIWYYDVNDETKGVIFTDGKGNQSKDYMGDKTKFADQVFGYAEKNSTTDVDDVIYGNIDDYDQSGELTDYKIYFHNKDSWDNVNVKIIGYGEIGGEMESFLNSSVHDFSFTAPERVSLTCYFYLESNGQEVNPTARFSVVNGHVYTTSGDKGDYSSYDVTNTLPEKEFWFDPATPSQLQKVTLYFNKTYVADSKLKDTDDIYLYAGLVEKDTNDSQWFGVPNWGNPGEKFKMERDADRPNLYSLSFEPSLAQWFGAADDQVFTKLGFIFRNADGSVKQHSADQFLNLRQIADPTEGLGACSGYTIADGSVLFSAEKGTLKLTPVSEQVVKVFTLPSGASVTTERRSISVSEESFTNPDFNIEENDLEYVVVIDGGLKVHVEKAASKVSFHDRYDNLYLAELSGLSNRVGNIKATFQGMEDEAFYGGGYNGNRTNWEGATMIMNNTQTGNWGQGTSHPHNICIPFYVSTKGYGLYFDDHYRNASIIPTATGSCYTSKSKNPIAYYFIGGGDMTDGHGSMRKAVENYTRLTGLQELPPYWALGYITSKFSFESRNEAEETIRKTKDINIPIDAIVFDIHWQGGTQKMGRIDWDTDRYNAPTEMISNFRNQNVHSIVITEPFFTSNSGNYEYMKSHGFFSDDHVEGMGWLNSEHVGLLDVTNPDAVNWFKDLYKKRTLEGIDGWWLDLGEPEKHDPESQYQEGDINQVHNEYGNLWCEFVLDALKECRPDMRHMLMPRAGTSGMQRFNTFPWTGDISRSWNGLKAQVPALVSGAMSGVSYLGSDIGGFSTNGGSNPQLYRRWVQLGVFYPAMRTHSTHVPEVWQDVYREVRDDVRDAINLRYAYLPYTYTQSYTYSRFGTPIARPANFDDADKSVLANCIDAYYWGPDVFVAPVLSENDSRTITFPEGEWLDMNDFTTIYPGHVSMTYSASPSTLPHFMRRGSFVTRYRQDTFTSTAEIETNRITVDYFPSYGDKPDQGMFYDDDHISSTSIKDGNYVVTNFTAGKSLSGEMSISIEREGNGWDNIYDGEPQDILLCIHDYRDGVSSPRLISPSDIHRAEVSLGSYSADGFQQLASLDEVKAEDNIPSYAKVGDKLYVRLPRISPTGNYTMIIDNDVILSQLEKPYQQQAMTLAYSGNVITYYVPEGTSDLSLSIHDVTGALTAFYDSLPSNGTAVQVETELLPGLYVATLSGRDKSGKPIHKIIKMIAG